MTNYVLYEYNTGTLATTNVYGSYRDAASDADDLKGAGIDVLVLPIDVPGDDEDNTATEDEETYPDFPNQENTNVAPCDTENSSDES